MSLKILLLQYLHCKKMSKRNSLLKTAIWLTLLCILHPVICPAQNDSKVTKEVVILSPNKEQISYKKGTTIIAQGQLLNGEKSGFWQTNFSNNEIKSIAEFYKGKLNGRYQVFYENGQQMSTTNFKDDLPVQKWTSYYENGNLQGQIMWGKHNLPMSVQLYFENGVLAFQKTFEYENHSVSIHINSFYDNKIPFENYTIEFKLEEFKNQLYSITLETKPHLLFSTAGTLTGFYERKYNTGKTWMYCEFYAGKLLEVLEQNTPLGTPIRTWKTNGSGKLVHFHHLKDTGAIVNYINGYKNGSIKYFHGYNKIYKTGYFINNFPDSTWTLHSESGKIRQKLEAVRSTATWTFYGPKNKREATYTLKDGLLDGISYRYNFFGDTTAAFSYKHGLLNGKFTKFNAGAPLRSGFYKNSEQIGNWLTHGQFNQVSHETKFGKKQVIAKLSNIPPPKFSYLPSIRIPTNYNFVSKQALSLTPDLFLYTKSQFSWLLFQTPDSDELWGTTWLEATISPFGLIKNIVCLKSPTSETALTSNKLVSKIDLVEPKYLCGFPIKENAFIVLEHYKP